MCLQRGASVLRVKRPSDRARLSWNAAVLQRLSSCDGDDGGRAGVRRIGGGGEHLGAGVCRVPLREWACCEIAEGVAVEGGSK